MEERSHGVVSTGKRLRFWEEMAVEITCEHGQERVKQGSSVVLEMKLRLE
jgi:hypothetical protein